MTDEADAFWAWSLARYPAVESLALRLQDEYGADVNLLLFCAFRGRLSAAALEAADRAVGPWRREVVEPLRRARRAARGTPLHASLKAAELAAERLAQERICAAAAGEPPGHFDAVPFYLERLGVPEPLRTAAIKAFGGPG
jgi:uncharacterized protein (TIGR02444 family)